MHLSTQQLKLQVIIKRKIIERSIVDVLKPLLIAPFGLFRGSQFLMVEEAGVPGENHRPSIGKLTILIKYDRSRVSNSQPQC